MEPHPVQVISILRLIGCDKKDNKILSCLKFTKLGLGV